MRMVVRAIAAMTVAASLVWVLEGGRVLAIVGLGIHAASPAQLLIYSVTAGLGALGMFSGLLLARFDERGRRCTLVLLLLVALWVAAADLVSYRMVRLVLLAGAAACLLSSAAAVLCRRRAASTNTMPA